MHDATVLPGIAAALRLALPEWDMGGAALHLLSVSENATYRAQAADRDLAIRVHRPGYHDTAALRSELDWIMALRRDSVVDTPAPVAARSGHHLVALPGIGRTATAFAFAPGQEPVPGPALFRRLGRMAARLHRHARGWQPPAGFVRPRWDFQRTCGPRAALGDWRALPGLDPAGRAVLERAAARLAACPCGPELLIHGDMRAANLLQSRDRLVLIDFDDCGTAPAGADFAAAVSFVEHDPAVPEWQDAWLEGYRRAGTLDRESAESLPALVLRRRLQLAAWIASHAETPTAAALAPGFAQGTIMLAERFLGG